MVLTAARGDQVRAGDVLAEIYFRTADRLETARPLFARAWMVGEQPPPAQDLILETVG